ncbi:MAG TPA: hypothetical protein VHJ17_08430 [Thermomonospora sp.]|nr:hypothetical protein [Thermomonospora sp.]
MSGGGDALARKVTIWVILLSVILLVVIIAVAEANDDDEVSISGGGLFGTQGAERLVERLNAASRAQGVCYGWKIDSDEPRLRQYSTPVRPSPPPVTPSRTPGVPSPRPVPPAPDLSVTEPGVDVGSNLGTGLDPREQTAQCPRWVVFEADYFYSYSEEEWTSVTPTIETNLPLSLSYADLVRSGITTRDLLGDQANARLADAIGTLPMLVAEKGGARPVPQVAAEAPPPGDRITPPGVARHVWMGIGGVLVAGGLVWIVIAAVRSRRSA